LTAGDGMKIVQKLAIASVLVLAWPGVAAAINCKLAVSPINFGVYMPMTSAPVDVVGQITVRCQAQPGTFSVLIGPGLTGDHTDRAMSAGAADRLYYNLYRDAARIEIWGDGTPPTFTQSGARTQKGRPTFFNLPVYGRIYANQAPDTGVYNDNLLVTVLF
jgi:spore coat protein U-like protein